MASKLYVTEYPAAGIWHGTGIPVAYGPPINTQVLDYSGGAATSTAFKTNTTLIRIHTDSVCSFLVSKTGTSAQTTDSRLAANATEYFQVLNGQFISAITNT